MKTAKQCTQTLNEAITHKLTDLHRKVGRSRFFFHKLMEKYSCMGCLELRLDIADNIVIHLEGLRQNVIRNIRLGPKHCIRNCDNTRVLTAQSSNGDGVSIINISLIVYEANWKYKHIALLQHLFDKVVLRIRLDKPNFQATFQDS